MWISSSTARLAQMQAVPIKIVVQVRLAALGNWQLACIDEDGFVNAATGGEHEW